MKTLPDNSIDAIVTDPPYGLKFMGINWDYGIPGIPFWQEALRIAKPGSHLMAFGGTRTHHRLMSSIEDAGWEMRDCLMWVYGSGFPKSKNHLKPAWEPIILARKKGKSELNIDDCRIEGIPWKEHDATGLGSIKFFTQGENPIIHKSPHPQGRWPANLILDEDAGKLLDEQSGILKSGKLSPENKVTESSGWSGGSYPNRIKNTFESNSGGASRFFYCAKASPKERGEMNKHPTVKPLSLMKYLIKLITPPGGVVLDPFSGSGSTLIAAKQEGYNYIGIELNQEYVEIAKNRISKECVGNLNDFIPISEPLEA